MPVISTSGSASVTENITAVTNPGGSNTQGQFNDNGSFGGMSGVIWDKTNSILKLGAPNGAPTGLANSQISFYLNEAGNQLKVAVKYSDGTTKTATIALL
jgi:hypothetical protein